VCLVEVAVIFHYLFSIVCRLFGLGSTGYFLYVVHFYRNPATGYAENKWRAVLDVPKFLLTPLEWILESFV
jgi:hypothetical protein